MGMANYVIIYDLIDQCYYTYMYMLIIPYISGGNNELS